MGDTKPKIQNWLWVTPSVTASDETDTVTPLSDWFITEPHTPPPPMVKVQFTKVTRVFSFRLEHQPPLGAPAPLLCVYCMYSNSISIVYFKFQT